jgi:hypothetical protein
MHRDAVVLASVCMQIGKRACTLGNCGMTIPDQEGALAVDQTLMYESETQLLW